MPALPNAVCNENRSILWVTAARPSPASLRSPRSLAVRAGGTTGPRSEAGQESAAQVPCVLRDAPRLRRVAPQHEGMFFMALRKMPHPEVPREARPRGTHDILPALRMRVRRLPVSGDQFPGKAQYCSARSRVARDANRNLTDQNGGSLSARHLWLTVSQCGSRPRGRICSATGWRRGRERAGP
jgi:hypothetical protein